MADKNYNYKDNLKKAYTYMTEKLGYTDIVARALVGNFMQESNLNPSAKNAIGATGIAQWLGARKTELKKQPNWDTLEGQLDFMDKEFKTTEKSAWKAVNNAKTINEATQIVREKYERPGEDEANDKRRKSFANFDDEGNPSQQSDGKNDIIERKKAEIRAKRDNAPTVTIKGKKWRLATDEDLEKKDEIIEGPNGEKLAPEFGEAQSKRILKETEDEIAEIKAGEKADQKKIDQAKNEADAIAIKESLIDEQKKKSLEGYNKDLSSFNAEFTTPEDIKPSGVAFDKKDFPAELPIAALGQGALALLGLSQADVEIPRNEEEIGDATLAFLQKNRELSEKGLPLELEAKARRELAEATKVGIDNIVRGSGGNRNLVLANLGGLDVARAKGISALNIADMQARDEAFGRYGETLARIDEFESGKYKDNLRLDQAEAYQKQNEGKALANQGFAQMLNEIQIQKENGPGSMKHTYQSQMAYDMWGVVPGMKDDGTGTKKGTQSYKEVQEKKASAYNAELAVKVADKERMDGIYSTLTDEERIALKDGGWNPATVNTEQIQSKEDLLTNYVPEYVAPQGYTPVDNVTPIDKDTFRDSFGVTHRMTGDKGFSFDAKEKGQPGGTGLNWWDAVKNDPKAIQSSGQDKYGRDLTAMQVQVGNEWMDSAFLQNKIDPVNFYDPLFPTNLDEIINSNQSQYKGQTPFDFRQSNK